MRLGVIISRNRLWMCPSRVHSFYIEMYLISEVAMLNIDPNEVLGSYVCPEWVPRLCKTATF